jgi:hypothetical protein
MKSFLLLLALSFNVVEGALAQGENNSLKGVSPKERIVTGGGFGLGFTRQQDFVSLSPVIGYAITKKFVAGTGVTYCYTRYKDIIPGKDISVNDIGINPFARFVVYQGFFAQVEYEYLNYEGIVTPSLETERRDFNSFMAGGGLQQPLGERSSFFVMVLYNFSYRTPLPGEFVPYDSPWVIRAGINIGGFIF